MSFSSFPLPPPQIMNSLRVHYPKVMQRNFMPWKEHFALFPVRLKNGKKAWLRQVYKRLSFIPLLGWRSTDVEYTDSIFDVMTTKDVPCDTNFTKPPPPPNPPPPRTLP